MNLLSKSPLYKNITTATPVPNDRQLEWYRREKTAFFHFGINTFTGNEWGDGSDSPSLFNPTELNCKQWIKTIKDAGFTAAILTAKHHDGFCLWPSKYTDYSIKSSPFKDGKGDIVREFTEACKEFGVKAGIYLSPWDRHEVSWGTDAYNDYYANQLTELLTNYGEIYECWWDGAGSTKTCYDWERWANIVHTLQPNAVIFGSLGATPHVDVRWVGNEKGVAGRPCWSTIDPISLELETVTELNSGKLTGTRFIPAEVDVSIRPGWFYHPEEDDKVRTPENLLELWLNSVGRNAGLLLNLPPDKRGLIPQTDVKALTDFSALLKNSTADNLIKHAKVSATSTLSEEFSAENLLDDNECSFYISSSDYKLPEIEFDLGEEKEFNMIMLREGIEFGHTICGYEIQILKNNRWETILVGECIGYKCFEPLGQNKASKIRVKITKSFGFPILRELALYCFE